MLIALPLFRLLPAIIVLAFGAGLPGFAPSPVEYSQLHMGVAVRIRFYPERRTRATDVAAAAFARIAALDRMMSDYRPDSDLRTLGVTWTRVSPDLFTVLQRAVDIAEASDGAFDPSVGPLVALWRDARQKTRFPDEAELERAKSRVGWRQVQLDKAHHTVRLARADMRLDLGGIAKGYIIQEALKTLAASGVTRALIEAGGDIVVGDAPPGRDGWRIEVDGADAAFQSRAARLTNAALATSGPSAQFVEINGVRYSHVVDPRTGLGLTNNITAHVIARDGATADGLATALTVIGRYGAPALLEKFPGVLSSVH
jgi:FAD:protein FMN transferase